MFAGLPFIDLVRCTGCGLYVPIYLEEEYE
jgi:hypothetical protein